MMKRKKVLQAFILTVVVLLVLSQSQAIAGAIPHRSFELTYEVHLDSIPSDARELRVWIPMATNDRHQQIRQRLIHSPVSYQVTKDPEYGNDILYLDLRTPIPPTLDLAVLYEADVHGEQVELAKASSVPSGLGRKMQFDLQSNRYMVVNDEVRALAQAVAAGAPTPAEKVERIYRYVIERMTYEKETPGWGNGDTVRACSVGTGNCTDFHSLFISLARACGIPARFQIGLPVPNKAEGEIPGYHCWAFVYLPKMGWVPVDASEAWKDRKRIGYFLGTYDPNRFALSTGRDIQLLPKPASGRVNIFFAPYVEIDGKSIDKSQIKTKFRFRDVGIVQGVNHA